MLKGQNEQEIRKQLLKFRGIGEWTCDMILFFSFKNDVFPSNDLIIEK